MIGLDTNVLVRYIVRDNPRQTTAATRLIESKCTPENPGLVASIVLAKLYGYWIAPMAMIEPRFLLLRRLLTVEELQVQESDLAWSALNFYEEGKADFADYVIGLSNQIQDAETIFTLHREAAENPLFQLLAF